MSKQVWKPGAVLAPVPAVLVSVGNEEKNNLLTIGWTGIVNTIPPMVSISVRPERYSYELLLETGEFVINLPPEKLVRAVDFCGVRSGRALDKWKETGLTRERGSATGVPLVGECPVNLECRVKSRVELGSHHMFLADILAVHVEERLLDQNGRLCMEKAELLAYSHGEYFSLGERLGSFGYSVRKKKRKRR